MTTTRPDFTLSRALPLWVPFLVLAVAWLAHARALQAGWVLDDREAVRDHRVVRDGLGGAGTALGADWAGPTDGGTWRPLTVATFCLEAAVARTPGGVPRAFFFHLTNVLLHSIAALLLLAVVRRVAPGRPWLAAGAALVFAVHPIHAATVAAVVGRADLLALLFSLTAVLCWTGSASGGRPVLLPLTALSFFAALLAKETALALPLVLLLLDRVRPEGPVPLRARWPGYAFLAAALVLFALRWPGPTAAFPASLAAGVEGLGRAVAGLVFPIGLVQDRLEVWGTGTALPYSGVFVAVGVGLLAVAAFGLGRLCSGRGAGVLGFGALLVATTGLIGAAVAPSLAPLETSFVYVSAPALFLVAGLALEALLGQRPGHRARARHARVLGPLVRVLSAAGAGVLLVALAAGTWQIQKTWRTDEAWHLSAIERQPDRLALQVGLAAHLREEAEAGAYEAATLPVSSPRRAHLLGDPKHPGVVQRGFESAQGWAGGVTLRVDASRPDALAAWAHRELGFVLVETSQPADASDMLRRALDLDPWLQDDASLRRMPRAHGRRVAETYLRLGRAEEAMGERETAAGHYQSASEFAPRDLDLLQRAGRSMMRANRAGEAADLLRRALELATDPRVRRDIEKDLQNATRVARQGSTQYLRSATEAENAGHWTEAMRLYQAALEADPESVAAWYSIARISGVMFGRFEQAEAAIGRADLILDAAGTPADDAWRNRLRDLRASLARQRAEVEEEERREFGEEDER